MANPYLGEIRLAAFNFAPAGWAFCNGSLLSIAQNDALFALIGTTYGGDGQSTFGLPDLRGRVPTHHIRVVPDRRAEGGSESVTLTISSRLPSHNHESTTCSGDGRHVGVPGRRRDLGAVELGARSTSARSPVRGHGQPGDRHSSGGISRTTIASRRWRSTTSSPSRASSPRRTEPRPMTEPGPRRHRRTSLRRSSRCQIRILGEIRPVGFTFAPVRLGGSANGQTLAIGQNTALFSLLGVNFGGNGTSTFALPNLQGNAWRSAWDRGPACRPTPSARPSARRRSRSACRNWRRTTIPRSPTVAGDPRRRPTDPGGQRLGQGCGERHALFERDAQRHHVGRVGPRRPAAGGAHNNLMPYQVVLRSPSALQGIFPRTELKPDPMDRTQLDGRDLPTDRPERSSAATSPATSPPGWPARGAPSPSRPTRPARW